MSLMPVNRGPPVGPGCVLVNHHNRIPVTRKDRQTMSTKTETQTWKRVEGSNGVFVKFTEEGDADEGTYLGKAPTGQKGNVAYSFRRDDNQVWKCWECFDLREKLAKVAEGQYVRITFTGLGSDGRTKLFDVDVRVSEDDELQ